jgi:hypothetical protein
MIYASKMAEILERTQNIMESFIQENMGFFNESIPNIDLTAKTLKMKKYGQNIKLLFADFLEKETFCSEIKYCYF